MTRRPILWMLIFLALALALAASAPLEKTLGANARVVYFHGAWVWAAILGFFAAALTGIVGLAARKHSILAWSQALGRSAICFWIGFLPLSLLVMQLNWNGLFLDEPRASGFLSTWLSSACCSNQAFHFYQTCAGQPSETFSLLQHGSSA